MCFNYLLKIYLCVLRDNTAFIFIILIWEVYWLSSYRAGATTGAATGATTGAATAIGAGAATGAGATTGTGAATGTSSLGSNESSSFIQLVNLSPAFVIDLATDSIAITGAAVAVTGTTGTAGTAGTAGAAGAAVARGTLPATPGLFLIGFGAGGCSATNFARISMSDFPSKF